MSERVDHSFPPFKVIARSMPAKKKPTENLTHTLGRILCRDDWEGVPDPQSIAAALRQLLTKATFDDKPHRRDRWPDLVKALVEAFEDTTEDGWRLDLKGPPHRPLAGLSKDRRDYEIGLFFEERKASGYEAALTETRTQFCVGNTTIKEAHRKFRKELEEHERWINELRDHLKNGTGPFGSD